MQCCQASDFASEVNCIDFFFTVCALYESESDVTYDQVWWPILRIIALHLTHPKCTHTAVSTHTHWTHTQSSGQPFMLRHQGSSWGFGVLLKGTTVVVLRVKRALYIHSPPPTIPAGSRLKLAIFYYKSDSVTIRQWLPKWLIRV